MVAGQPYNKNEENAVGPDHLHFFRSGKGGAEGNAQGRGRDIVAYDRQQAEKQASQQKKDPEGKRYLSRGQKGEADKGGIDIDFQFVETGKQTEFRKVGAGQNEGGHLGNAREIKIQAVQQVQGDRYQQPHQHETVQQELPECALGIGFFHQQRNPQERKIHALVAQPLLAEKVDQADHDKIAQGYKEPPGE